MNNRQVAHLWANQSKQSAKGSNFYFEGKTIFSYGSHFPIARIFGGVILFTTKKFSVSTSKHINYTVRAIDFNKFTVIFCPFVKSLNRDNLLYLETKITELKSSFSKPRTKKEFIFSDLLETIKQYKVYCKLLKVKTKKSICSYNAEKYQAEIKLQSEKAEIANNKRLALELVKRQAELNKFLNGDEKIKTIEYREDTNFLKIVGEKAITNNGAEVEVNEVKKLLKMMKSESDCSGIKVGNFLVDYFSENGIKIGCHFFDTQEINRIISLFK